MKEEEDNLPSCSNNGNNTNENKYNNEHENVSSTTPRVTVAERDTTAISYWYPMFDPPPAPSPVPSTSSLSSSSSSSSSADHHHPRSRLTFPSVSIPVSSNFIDFLLSDGVVLPPCAAPPPVSHLSDDDEDQEDDHSHNDNHDPEPNLPAPSHCDIDIEADVHAIQDALHRLGGEAFPKLNWSAPHDASWMLPGSMLKCTSAADVLLVLKSSDLIARDISSAAYEDTVDHSHNANNDEAHHLDGPTLMLREWYDIRQTTEFRIFVRDGNILAGCQRHHTVHVPFLQGQEQQTHLAHRIHDFLYQYVIPVFPLPSFAVDLYLSRYDLFYIVDFGVFGEPTDPIMFSWDELLAMDHQPDALPFPLRVVESPNAVAPSPSMYDRLPADLVALAASSGQGNDPTLTDLLEQVADVEQN